MLTIQRANAGPFLPAFERLLGAQRTTALHEAAKVIGDRLRGGTLWHVNSTPSGGGVAEMLQTLMPIYSELGIRCAWAVVGGSDQFFDITKRLGLALYGSDGDRPLELAERAAYLRALSPAAERLTELVGPTDIVVLHDHQTAGLAPALAGRVASVHWRCHVGVDEPSAASERGWDFVEPMLEEARSLIFSVAEHVPDRYSARPVHVIAPFIWPVGPKNRELAGEAIEAALARCGLRPPPGEPLITQVSRWDRLKDMAGVMQAVTSHVPRGHLALVGPDPSAIADDIEQQFWYTDCADRWQALPPAQRRRVSLVCLPMSDLDDNALMVNAIQRASTVVVQKSLAEGFGLTVAEAMWKSRVVVGSAVGGIRAQITDGVDGLLLPDPADLAGLGRLVTRAVEGDVPDDMGRRAHLRVHEKFLPDQEVRATASMIVNEGISVS